MAREPGWAPSAADTFRTITARNLIALSLLIAVSTPIAWLVWGSVAGWGWFIGCACATGATLFTLGVMIATERWGSGKETWPMVASYLVKALLLIAILQMLSGYDFYSKVALGLGFLIALIISLIIDTVTIIRTRA